MANEKQSFFWYELMTNDVPAAQAFYTKVVEWDAEAFGGEFMDYMVMKIGDYGVGGIMAMPPEAKSSGLQPCWVGYVFSADVDADVKKLEAAGGKVHRVPWDVPGVGRLAVVADPQGTMFNMMKPNGVAPPSKPAWDAPGMIGWRELYANDWEKAFAFYSGQFGWTKDHDMDMGPMGTYLIFVSGEDQMGGMMNKPPQVPHPYWGFYFIVADIDAATKRVTENGGKVLMGPVQVPGGGWIIQGMDPQGAMFALTGKRVA